MENLPSLRHGTLDADIHFTDNISNKTIKIIAVQEGWTETQRNEYTLEEGTNGWYHLSIDLADCVQYTKIDKCIRLGFGFPGVTTSNKNTAEIHIDNIRFEQDAGKPEPPELETEKNGLENGALDTGWLRCHYVVDSDVYYNSASNKSTSSMKLTFDGITPNDRGYSFILDTSAKKDNINLTSDNISFDLRFQNVSNVTVKIFAVSEDWSNIPSAEVTSILSDDGWYHFSINLGDYSQFAAVAKCIRFGFTFMGIDDTNKNTAIINIDNVLLNK